MGEIIGLDIGSHSIKLVGLKMTSKGAFLTHLGIEKIPLGHDEDRVYYLSQLVKDLFKKLGIKSGKVNITISGSGIQIKRISLPSMPKDELKEAIRWEMKEHLPFPVETAQIEFHILGEVIEDKIKKLDLMVVACPNHLIDQTLNIAKNAELQPVHLNVGPFALWNAFEAWGQVKEEEEVALIDLGADKTGILFFRGKGLQFYREITPAGTDISRSIIEGMGGREDASLLFEKAENIKKALGVSSEGIQEALHSFNELREQDKTISLQKITFYMRPILERMAGEIGRSLDFYQHEFNVDRIDKVLLTGGGAHLKNLSSYLSKELQLPVEEFNPLKEMLYDAKKIPVQILDEMSLHFTIAGGVTLTRPRRIEFLPAKEPFITKERFLKSIPILAPLITIIIFSLIIWNTNRKITSIKQVRDNKVAKVANIDTLQAKLTLLKEKEKKVKQELSVFPSLAILSTPYEEILREMSQIIPENVTLSHLSVQVKKAPSTPSKEEAQSEGKRELHLGGIAFGSDTHCLTALAQIIEGFEKSQRFKNTKLLSADENKLYNRPAVEFEIVCDIVISEKR